MSGGPFDELVERLEQIAADLDDRSFDLLRAASAERSGRPLDDRRLMQARRAIDKAIHVLRGPVDDEPPID